MCGHMQYNLLASSKYISSKLNIKTGFTPAKKNVWFVPVFHLCGKPYYITQLYIDNLVLKITKIHVAQRGDLKAKFFCF